MNTLYYFESKMLKKLHNVVSIKKRNFSNGQFGDLIRYDIASDKILSSICFWSKGWLEMDIIDLSLDSLVYHKLLSPDEVSFLDIDYFIEVICEKHK